MNARLIDVESGGVQQTTRVKGSFKNIFDLQNLAKNTLTWMNVTPVGDGCQENASGASEKRNHS